MRPDEQWDQVSAWDEARITQLVVRHQRGVAASLASLGCAPANIEDLVQETFLTLLGLPFEERSPAATSAFLRRIARNLFLKSVRRRREIPDLEAIDAAWVAFEGHDGGDTYLTALRQCLLGLNDSSRAALTMRYQDGLAAGEIAARLSLSLGGAKSLLLRAKERLRACIQKKVRP